VYAACRRLLMAGVGSAVAIAVSVSPALAFTNFELGAQPQGVPGQTCPAAGAAEQQCTNIAAEPAIRADPAGNFYASSENGLGGGTDAWKSPLAANGQSYTYLGEPDAGSATLASTGFAPGGGDTDLAVAPVENASGFYNVYVASLSLANVDVSTSTDGGKSFTLNPLGATVPLDDREWIAADGSSKVCVSYHDLATDNIDVDCSTDAGATFTQLGEAIDPAHEYLLQNNEIGNLAIDPTNHYVYQVLDGIGSQDTVCSIEGTCGYHVVYMAVSTDGGRTFTDHQVYAGPPTSSYDHNFTNVSVDRAGNVYAVYSDNHRVYMSYSTDHGASWHGPYTVSQSPANTAIYPWSTAGDAGRLAIVYYGSSYYNATEPPDNYPPSAQWNVYYAENDEVLTNPGGFSQVQASPVNHTGAVCEGGVSCTGNRDLYDDFGVAVSPVTNAASIVYSDDQYDGFADNPPPSGCTPSTNDSASCDHTNVATGASQLFTSSTGSGTASGRVSGKAHKPSPTDRGSRRR
jgi:hypothetical protein